MQNLAVARAPKFPSFVGTIAPEQAAKHGSDALDMLGTVMSVRAGTEVYGEGDDAIAWYRVQSGVLRTCKLLPDGRRQVEDFLFAGDFFGLEVGGEHNFAAEAVTSASVIRYARPRLNAVAAADARVATRLLDVTLTQLGKAYNRLTLLGRKTAEEKLATFLLEMLDRSPNPTVVDLSMSRTDIADYLGLTIETVSRTFSALKHDGVIALPSAQHVVILDREALEELSGDE
ncbi:MAG TPA: helix-turn-helix domain-containing protein [Alphaproteobacteria bacterium]|nr:helix-turn-helix domain-containing protein [Alphaproteobacteria bacterium]